MTESRWTTTIKRALKNKGRQLGYETDLSEKDIMIGVGSRTVKIRPDVVWSTNGNVETFFEIDTGARDQYAKTIYGSILTGLILARQKNAQFVEIVPRSTKNGDNAWKISDILKKQFNLPEFYVIQVGRIRGKYAPENTQKDLIKELKKANLIQDARHMQR